MGSEEERAFLLAAKLYEIHRLSLVLYRFTCVKG